jgi:hypothetical protein
MYLTTAWNVQTYGIHRCVYKTGNRKDLRLFIHQPIEKILKKRRQNAYGQGIFAQIQALQHLTVNLKMGAAYYSKMSEQTYDPTQCSNRVDYHSSNICYERLKMCIIMWCTNIEINSIVFYFTEISYDQNGPCKISETDSVELKRG